MSIYLKFDQVLYYVLTDKTKYPSYTFALSSCIFVFLFLLFHVEHLITTCGHHHHLYG
jgi:hypothetical protein